MRELPSIGALQTLQTRQRRPYLYQATEDAAWTSTGWTTYSSTWRVKVKKVKMDGTLDTIELTKDCIGAETDPLPIASGDYCIETVTADGLRALVRYETGRQLYVAQGDATLAAGVYSVSGKKMLIDGTTPGSAKTFTAAKRYVPTIGAVLNAPIRSGEIFTLLAIDGTGASVAVALDFGEMPQPFDVFATSSTNLKICAGQIEGTGLDDSGTYGVYDNSGPQIKSISAENLAISEYASRDVWIVAGTSQLDIDHYYIATTAGAVPDYGKPDVGMYEWFYNHKYRIASVTWSNGVASVVQHHRGSLRLTLGQKVGPGTSAVVYMPTGSGIGSVSELMPLNMVEKTIITGVDFEAETTTTATAYVFEEIPEET
jgi:hypothetical protein